MGIPDPNLSFSRSYLNIKTNDLLNLFISVLEFYKIFFISKYNARNVFLYHRRCHL